MKEMTDRGCGAPATREAARRYKRGMYLAGGLYTLVIMAAVWGVSRFDPPPWVVIAAALAPLGPMLLMLRTYLTFMRAVDELQRRIQTESMLIALGVVAFSSFGYGFLEEWARFPHVPLLWVLPAIIAVWGVAVFFVSRRYQ